MVSLRMQIGVFKKIVMNLGDKKNNVNFWLVLISTAANLIDYILIICNLID